MDALLIGIIVIVGFFILVELIKFIFSEEFIMLLITTTILLATVGIAFVFCWILGMFIKFIFGI